MSLGTALSALRETVAELGSSVAELVMTVHEDRPTDCELAVVDHLAELVSELQASVVEAAAALTALADHRLLPERLPAVDRAIAASRLRYWRDLRSHESVAELRRSAAVEVPSGTPGRSVSRRPPGGARSPCRAPGLRSAPRGARSASSCPSTCRYRRTT